MFRADSSVCHILVTFNSYKGIKIVTVTLMIKI